MKKSLDRSALLSMLRQAVGSDDVEPPPGGQRIVLWLYVNDSPHSLHAHQVVARVVDDYDPEQIEIRIINVSEDPAAAEHDGIVATPTLVKKYPAPKAWIAGSLDAHDQLVRSMLDLAGVQKKQ
jgi:circadian clock protein KaiB